jgi:hypothetical protein
MGYNRNTDNEGNTDMESETFEQIVSRLDVKHKKTVKLELADGSFTAEALDLFELPSKRVASFFATPADGLDMSEMISLFRLAVNDPQIADLVEMMSFRDAAEILGQWHKKSTINVLADEGSLPPPPRKTRRRPEANN